MKRKEKKIKNIMTDLIPYEITIYDEKDPAKTKNRIKKLIHERTSIYKDYLKNTQVFEKHLYRILFTQSCLKISKT